MFAVITSLALWSTIEKVINDLGDEFSSKIINDEVDILTELDKLSMQSVKNLIIDISCITNKDIAAHSIRRFRIKREGTRIIIIAPNILPGDKLISQIVTFGVYDIINPQGDIKDINIYDELFDAIQNPGTYARSVKWDKGYEFEVIETNKTSQVKPERVDRTERIERTKIEVVNKYSFIDRTFVGVVNLSDNAGSSFITTNLALAIAKNNVPVSVIEPPICKPYIFDAVGVEQRMDGQESFYSYAHVINEEIEIVRDKEFLSDDIYWIVPDPRIRIDQDIKWDSFKMLKLLTASRKTHISILDIGNSFEHESIRGVMEHIDILIVVIDPHPADCMINTPILEKFKELSRNGFKVLYVVNKWNDGVDKKKLLEFLNVAPVAYVPFADIGLVYKAIYDCKIPYSVKQIKECLNASISYLVNCIVPNELLHKDVEKKQGQGLKHIFNLRKKGE